MRLLSEQLYSREKFANLEEHAPLFKDYGHELVVPVKSGNMLQKAESFADRMRQEDVELNIWPLNGHYLNMLWGGYWVNSLTYKSTARLLQDMKPIIKNPNVKSVVLDVESFPLFGYLGDREKATETLEAEVDVIQKDYGKDVTLMEWYFSDPRMSKLMTRCVSNLPEIKNANKHTLMAYASMNQTKFAGEDSRKDHIKSAVDYGKKRYGNIGVDIGSNDTGVYERLLYPFMPFFKYGPKQMREDLEFARESGADSVGAYSVDGMGKKVDMWLRELSS